MQKRQRFARPALVLTCWALALLVLLLLGLALNHRLYRYVTDVRASDPNPALSEAEELMAQSRYMEALARIDDARQRAPEHPRVWKVTGDYHFRREQFREAAEAYERALQHGWEGASVPVNYLWSLIKLEYYEDVTHWGREFMKRYDSALIPRYIAEAFIRSGNRVDAIPYLERALAKSGEDPYLLGNLINAYRAAGRLDEAEDVQKRLLEVRARMQDMSLPAPE